MIIMDVPPLYDVICESMLPMVIAVQGPNSKPTNIYEVIAQIGPDMFHPVEQRDCYSSKTESAQRPNGGSPYMGFK